MPLHFLSEGESATRATAAEMGDPTFRHYRRRQRELAGFVEAVVRAAYLRAVAAGKARAVNDLQLKVETPEMVVSDNESLGRALQATVEALAVMRERGWVDDATTAGMAFRAAGEAVSGEEVKEVLEKAGRET